MNVAESYLTGAEQALAKVRPGLPQIKQAAKLIADSIMAGQGIFSFGASHSFIMTAELVYRSGGLMLVNPIQPYGMNLAVRPMTLTSQLERLPDLGRVLLEHSPVKKGDVLLLTSTSGRNAIVIDMALAAIEKGLHVVALTSSDSTSKVTIQ